MAQEYRPEIKKLLKNFSVEETCEIMSKAGVDLDHFYVKRIKTALEEKELLQLPIINMILSVAIAFLVFYLLRK